MTTQVDPRLRRTIVGLGAHGHAKSVLEAIASNGRLEVAGLVDPDPALTGRTLLGHPILGAEDRLPELSRRVAAGFVGVGGGPGEQPGRREAFALLVAHGFSLPAIVHRDAQVSASAHLEAGVQVLAGAIVDAGASLGEDVLVDLGAIVAHDARVGAHALVAPGARLCGGVRVDEGARVGPGAVVLEGRSVGAGAVVPAGAVVDRDVPAAAAA